MNLYKVLRSLSSIESYGKGLMSHHSGMPSFGNLNRCKWQFNGKDSVVYDVRGSRKEVSLLEICASESASDLVSLSEVVEKVLDAITVYLKNAVGEITITGVDFNLHNIVVYYTMPSGGDKYNIFSVEQLNRLLNIELSTSNVFGDIEKFYNSIFLCAGLSNLEKLEREMEFAGFSLVVCKPYLGGGEYRLYHHAEGVDLVCDTGRLTDKYTGNTSDGGVTVHVCLEGKDISFQSITQYNGGGFEYHNPYSLGFLRPLAKAHASASVKWGNVTDASISTFCIYSNIKPLMYLGGRVREEDGGDSRYLMLDDAYSSHDLSMWSGYYINIILLEDVLPSDIKAIIKLRASVHLQKFYDKFGVDGVSIIQKCKKIIYETIGGKQV